MSCEPLIHKQIVISEMVPDGDMVTMDHC